MSDKKEERKLDVSEVLVTPEKDVKKGDIKIKESKLLAKIQALRSDQGKKIVNLHGALEVYIDLLSVMKSYLREDGTEEPAFISVHHVIEKMKQISVQLMELSPAVFKDSVIAMDSATVSDTVMLFANCLKSCQKHFLAECAEEEII